MSHAPLPSTVQADPKRPWKAVIAALVALIGTYAANVAGAQDTVGNLSGSELLSIALTTLATFLGTYLVRNPKVYESSPTTGYHEGA
jgi:hypothetical protein